MAPGARCPHSRARVLSPAFGPALGPGPVNPVGVGVDGVVSTDGQGGAWIHNVTWIAAPAYAGSARIRGHQLNGDGTISFGTDVVANASELALTPANALRASRAPGWRQWRSVLAVTKPGCYGLQIDGAGFSTVVIFDVR